MLRLAEQLITPADDAGESALTLRNHLRPPAEQREAIGQPLRDLTRRKRPEPGRRELECEGEPVEALADLRDRAERRLVQLEIATHDLRTLDEEAHRIGPCKLVQPRVSIRKAQRRDFQDALSRNAEGLAAGGEQPNVETRREERDCELTRGSSEVLAVVENEQELASAQVALEEAERRSRLSLELRAPHAHSFGDGLRHSCRVADRRQLDEPRAVCVLVNSSSGSLDRKARLAHAARAGERHQPVFDEAVAHEPAFVLAADETREPGADVGPCGLHDRQLGCALEHLPLEPAGLLLRLESQLPQPFEESPVCGERVRVTAASVQGEHQQSRERLPQRMLFDEPLQVGEGFAVAAELEERRHAQLVRLQLDLLEAPRLRLREVQVDELAVGLPSPQRERLVRARQRLGGLEAASLDHEPSESLRIDVVVLDREPIAHAVALDHGSGHCFPPRLEQPAKPRDSRVERALRRNRGPLPPDGVDDLAGRDRAPEVREQIGEHRPLLRTGKLERPIRP